MKHGPEKSKAKQSKKKTKKPAQLEWQHCAFGRAVLRTCTEAFLLLQLHIYLA